ncbi:hypothetical protein MRX96_023417 [Rhipicephalus microplus]
MSVSDGAAGSTEHDANAFAFDLAVTVLLTEGATADLPCDLGPRSDPAVKVWWHRADDPTTALYTLDPPPGRRGNLMQARHSVAEPLRGRAHFSAVRRPALLSISALRYEDHGLYVCNVEYKHGSRRSYDVELHIVAELSAKPKLNLFWMNASQCKMEFMDLDFSK